MENGLKFLVSGVSMSAETAGHWFLGDDLKKSAIITFCFYIIAFVLVNFHSKCKILGGVAEFFSKAFLCRFPPENFPRPVVYPVHSLPV